MPVIKLVNAECSSFPRCIWGTAVLGSLLPVQRSVSLWLLMGSFVAARTSPFVIDGLIVSGWRLYSPIAALTELSNKKSACAYSG